MPRPGGGEGPARPRTPNAEAIDRYRRPDELVAALGLRPGQVVAEIGAGAGYLTPRLARAVGPTGRVIATDIDEALLEALRSRLRAEGLTNVEARRVAPREPGLEASCCDAVLLAEVDHLLPDRDHWLRALRPALRPGTRVFATNREPFLAPLFDAAASAGYTLTPLPFPGPGQFLAELRPMSPAPR